MSIQPNRQKTDKDRDSSPAALNQLSDFRQYLQETLIQRCRDNPRYSLRAFARALKTDPSFLSKLLREKKPIPQIWIQKAVLHLNLSPEISQRFLKPSHAASTSSASSSNRPAQTHDDYRQLTLDHFHLISDWYHYALFELTVTEGFQSSARWMAKRLGITVTEVNAALERMERLEILVKKSSKTGFSWARTSDHITTVGNEFTAAAFRKLQHQVIEMSRKSLEEVPMEFRDQSSLTVAINRKRLPRVKEALKKFRRELCAELESDSVRHEVYHLNLSFYPVTRLAATSLDKETL